MRRQALLTHLAMFRRLLPGLGTLLISGTFALNGYAMEPLSVSATDGSSGSLSISAEQAYFTESSEAWSRSVEEVQLRSAGQEQHQPPKGHTLLDMSF